MHIQWWFPVGLTGLISLPVKVTLKSLHQHHSSKALALSCYTAFMLQLSHPCMTSGRTIALTTWTFVGQVMSLLFHVLSRFVQLASFNFMAEVTICSDFGAQENKVCHCFHGFFIYLPWNDETFNCVDHSTVWKILKEMGCQTIWPTSWEICMQVKKQQLELGME